MGLYRKKPVLIEAVQFHGGNFDVCARFVGPASRGAVGDVALGIQTLEGLMRADLGDWIIKGVKGEFYPCKPDVFAATYEEVNARPTGPGAPEAGGHTFGWAIKQMQNGALVQREGWNGKGMHLYLEDMLSHFIGAGVATGATRRYEPCIVMFTAQGKHQPGWHPSTPDVLAADWRIAPGIPAAVVEAPLPLPATLPTYPSREGTPAGVETHGAGPGGCGMDPGPKRTAATMTDLQGLPPRD